MHYEAVEADFQRDYAINLNDELWVMTPRRFRALVMGLSTDSALYRAMYPDHWYWESETELLATIAELVDRLDLHFIAANSDPKKGKSKAKPIKIKRPWKKESSRQGTTMGQLLTLVKRDRNKEVTDG